ncbi:NAD-dependent dehydratase [Dyadobacter sp. CY323]|uniref:NAD-dependent dehydratase n=1 Tax=Dyadobacter sp. CY323 TaxID=2907302 RepID=UPI001F422205|nr:NAD-dependent dehydratase [Dyadobacter sp. CY323]MCE6988853.1 NAD-dependent dehydratase [Dyadobacter sp. CY323]
MIDNDSKIEKKRISILGCGWLGFPLAQRLREKHSTWEIKGSTTSFGKINVFVQHGIQAYLFDLNPGFPDDKVWVDSFFDSDLLIISLPPRLTKRDEGFYMKQMEEVMSRVENSPVKEIIFISSTGIYPELNRVVVEEDVVTPEQSASREMVAAENLVQSLRPEKLVTILRLGGLLGYNRNPGKYVAGKKDMETGSIPVNYIHPDDVIGIVLTMLEKGFQNETFNIVAPMHPTRKEIYEDSCGRFGWEVPTFAEPDQSPDFKVISNEKFNRHYDYDFKYPDPLKFYYTEE